METKTLHWWSGRAGEIEGPPSGSPFPSQFNTDAHAEKGILPTCASHSTKASTGAGVMGTGPILYTILRHYARCQSAKSAEALQPWPLTQELNGRGKVIRVLGFFLLKARHRGFGGSGGGGSGDGSAPPGEKSNRRRKAKKRELSYEDAHGHQRRSPLISVSDHMAVAREQTVRSCLLCLSAVL